MTPLNCYLLAGGGTGGHVYPMIAVADALRRLDPNNPALFVGTSRGLEQRLVPERGYQLMTLDVLPMRGGGARQLLAGAVSAAGVIPACVRILRRHRPRAVLSVGGYAAGPLSLTARTMGIPVALLEPNAIMGFSNRLLSRVVDRGYVAFENLERHFGRGRVLRTGVPLRDGFAPVPYEGPHEPIRILVLGGSQGAKSLNEVVPAALARQTNQLRILHQAGPTWCEPVTALYRAMGLKNWEVTPYIDDIMEALTSADLVISRSGAGALAEICAVGRPSLLVPYPFAADDHQRLNAESLERSGAAVVAAGSSVSVEEMASILSSLLCQPEALRRMARQAATRGYPEAAQRVAEDLVHLGSGERCPTQVEMGDEVRGQHAEEDA